MFTVPFSIDIEFISISVFHFLFLNLRLVFSVGQFLFLRNRHVRLFDFLSFVVHLVIVWLLNYFSFDVSNIYHLSVPLEHISKEEED